MAPWTTTGRSNVRDGAVASRVTHAVSSAPANNIAVTRGVALIGSSPVNARADLSAEARSLIM